MRTILVNYTGRKGGGAAFAYEATKALIEKEQNIIAIVSEYAENLNLWKQLPLKKLIILRTYNNFLDFIPRTFLFLLIYIWRIKKDLKGFNIDYVYCPMIQPWTIFINMLFKDAKKIVTVHDPEPHSGTRNFIFVYLANLCARFSDELIVLSESFRELCAKKFNKSINNVHYIPHGDFSYYKRVQKKQKIINYPKDHVNFLFFGRISKYKGLNILSKAYSIVNRELNNVTLTVAGSGDFSEFEEDYKRLKNVRVLNRWFNDDEVGSLFDGENIIVVLPYLDATQSGVIPIAIEYGVPIIASNTGGLSQQINHLETGILVEPKNPIALAEAMINLANNKELRESLANEAKRRNEKNSWGEIVNKLLKVMSSNP
ncbi:glycosyltransferase family 4 protein [Parageobacillus thermoglucosidasius]|uniref:glycosyltransferase family 4 protein n=1 Tax=Parageobacillus thermoglucosidasius TaxID=1426 RepID=UPI0027F696AE|nr:hypothetical protein PthstB1num2_18840 [Parageobacillus thermoglucosidasius]